MYNNPRSQGVIQFPSREFVIQKGSFLYNKIDSVQQKTSFVQQKDLMYNILPARCITIH